MVDWRLAILHFKHSGWVLNFDTHGNIAINAYGSIPFMLGVWMHTEAWRQVEK